MIKDRLSELQEKSVQHGGDAVTVSVVQINTSLQNDEEEEFFEEIDRLKSEVELLTKKIEDLKRKHNAIINPSVDDDERFLRGQVEDCNAEITGLAGRTNNGLKRIKLKLDDIKRQIEIDSRTADKRALLRAQQAHYNSLTRRFKLTMEEYSKTQLNYRSRLKARLKKQLQIVNENNEFDEEQIDEMIESGNMAIFDEGFIKMQQNKKILDELEIRKNEMYSLERAIQELHTLFVEMANLVEEQGDMVNRILDNVTNTEAYVEKAVEDVHAAARYQSSARRKKVWLFIFCLIGLAVVGLIIYLSMPAG